IGQILGYLLISMINDDMLKAMIGAIAIVIGCRYFIRLNTQTRMNEKRKMRKNIPIRASIWCSLSGFSSFISLTGG
ncbi:MAG: sulfite exporter TauE/SafE family protein, partial [Candidatus Puniceispirillales bacterium]